MDFCQLYPDLMLSEALRQFDGLDGKLVSPVLFKISVENRLLFPVHINLRDRRRPGYRLPVLNREDIAVDLKCDA